MYNPLNVLEFKGNVEKTLHFVGGAINFYEDM
jgi:hypothetical protein